MSCSNAFYAFPTVYVFLLPDKLFSNQMKLPFNSYITVKPFSTVECNVQIMASTSRRIVIENALKRVYALASSILAFLSQDCDNRSLFIEIAKESQLHIFYDI